MIIRKTSQALTGFVLAASVFLASGCGGDKEASQEGAEPVQAVEAKPENALPEVPEGAAEAKTIPVIPFQTPTVEIPDLPPSGGMAGNAASTFLESLKTKAEDGSIDAPYFLALKYMKGDGVQKDAEEAAKWMKMAANRGYADAQYEYGKMHETGTGVAENRNMAAMWYLIAGEKNQEQALQRVGALLNDLPESEREEIERLASTFVPE